MLTLWGPKRTGFCDGFKRRDFLKVGGLALGGMALPEILKAESTSGVKLGHKGVIMIFLAGGPPHQDMFDLKPEAPSEIRGEFKPIKTNVPGIEICELFPRLATIADKFALIRSLQGSLDRHEPHQCFSGFPDQGDAARRWPSLGSFASKVLGNVDPAVPPFIGLSPTCAHRPWGNPGESGWLGPQYGAFQPDDGPGMKNMVLNASIDVTRLNQRRQLLTAVDRVRRDIDATGQLSSVDSYTQQAFSVLTSSKLVEALDVEKEDPKLRERYGKGDRNHIDDGPWRLLDQFLVARRLVEAGARCVTLAFSRWDWHDRNFIQGRRDMPLLDQGLSALIEDIHNRGLDKDISVVVWGEFGRTPKVNANAGRDHWPNANFCFLAGGGMRTGQVIGATDKDAAVPVDRPIHPQEVLATLYHRLGLDPGVAHVTDHRGRPQYFLDYRDPIRELV